MGTYRSYITGFIFSLILTFAAFGAVWSHQGQGTFSLPLLIAVLLVLAAAQLLVQLYYFLHLGSESKPRWNLTSLLFAALVLVIIVGGSLWIMKNLDYHMDPGSMSEYMIKDEGFSHHH